MDKKYLISYLIENATSSKEAEVIQNLKIELDWRIYHYGDSFSRPWEQRRKSIAVELKQWASTAKNLLILNNSARSVDHSREIISSVYHPNIVEYLGKLGFSVKTPSWGPSGFKVSGTRSLYNKAQRIHRLIKNAPLESILSDANKQMIVSYQEELLQFYQKTPPRALLLFTDQYFFSKVAIDVFKKIGRPSFVLSHGLPGIYSKFVDYTQDKLLVWGKKIKENYLKYGFPAEKVEVIGHPSYPAVPSRSRLVFGLENILVLTKAIPWHQHSYDVKVIDRGLILIYLLSLKRVLLSLEIKRVRLRPHPSQNINWILDNIGRDFFVPDANESLTESLRKTSLVIGPTSTVLLETLYNGINYAVYEPQDNGIDLFGMEVVPPFDGTDSAIPVAKDDEMLKKILLNKIGCEPNALEGYIDVFDYEKLKSVI